MSSSPPGPPKKHFCGQKMRRGTAGKARRLLAGLSRTSSNDGKSSGGLVSISDQGASGTSYMDSTPASSFHSSSNVSNGNALTFETTNILEHMLALMRDGESQSRPQIIQTELKDLLSKACQTGSINEVVSYPDYKGFNIMQRAVIRNYYDFVEYLFMQGYHVSNIKCNCSSPLHLASKLGHARIVRLLIDYGADLNELSTACYPNSMNTHSGSTSSYICCSYNGKFTPLYIAISRDNIDVVKVIMTHDPSKSPTVDFATLQFACRHAAEKCLAFLVQLAPQKACLADKDGQSLLALAFIKSDICGRVLLESEMVPWPASVLMDCTGKQDSILHIIYKSNWCENLLELTLMTFKNGLPPDCINMQDRNGNTPLHIIMKQVGRKVGYPWNASLVRSIPSMKHKQPQMNKDEQVFESIALLLEKGAALHMRNKIGESVLHHLLQDSFYRRLYGMPSGYYHGILPEINRVLEFLLSKGADVNSHTYQVSSPMTWFTHVLCSMESSEVETTWPEILYTYRLFCRYGGDPNLEDEKGISNISLMLTAVSRWLNQCVSKSEKDKAYIMLRHVHELLDLFFKHGLQPSTDVLDLCIKQLAILANVSIMDKQFLIEIRELLVPFFINGINPNTMHLVSECSDNPGVPCPLNAQFYLARALVIHLANKGMLSFLSLFEQSLEQDSLNQFVRGLCSILSTNFLDESQGREDQAETQKCIEMLSSMSRKPRSLKVLSKVQIASSLQWQLKKWKNALPLPPALQEFIVTFSSPLDV